MWRITQARWWASGLGGRAGAGPDPRAGPASGVPGTHHHPLSLPEFYRGARINTGTGSGLTEALLQGVSLDKEEKGAGQGVQA